MTQPAWPPYEYHPRDEEIRRHTERNPTVYALLLRCGAIGRWAREETALLGKTDIDWERDQQGHQARIEAVADSHFGQYSIYHLSNHPPFVQNPKPTDPAKSAFLELQIPREEHTKWEEALDAHQQLLAVRRERLRSPAKVAEAAERLNEAVRELNGLTLRQGDYIHDTVEYIIPNPGGTPELADETLVARYCERIQHQINFVAKHGGWEYRSTIHYTGDMKPPIICHFERDTQRQGLPSTIDICPDYQSLLHRLPKAIAEQLLYRYECFGKSHGVHGQDFWVVKNNLAPSWCQTAALHDSNEIFRDLMEAEDEGPPTSPEE